MDSSGKIFILLVCGGGFATSQLAIHTIKTKLEERGFKPSKFRFEGEQFYKLRDKLGRIGDQVDIIVSAIAVNREFYNAGTTTRDIPILRSTAFVVGSDEQINKDMDKLIEMLKIKPQ